MTERLAKDGRNYECFKRKHLVNNEYFSSIDSKEKAYWLGFLYADGHIGSGRYVIINLHRKDREHLELFLKCISSQHKIKDVDYVRKPRRKHLFPYVEYKSGICIGAKRMCEDLINLGCIERKTKTLKYPSREMVPTEFILDFISGFFDGDGSIYKENKTSRYGMSFISTHEFIQSLKIELENLGLTGYPTKRSKNTNVTSILEIKNIKGVREFYDKIYSKSIIKMKRKEQKFKEFYEQKLS